MKTEEIYIKNSNIFIGKIISAILMNILSIVVLYLFNLFFIPIIVFTTYFIINYFAFYKMKYKYILTSIIIDGLLLIAIIVMFVLIFTFVDFVERASHGAIVIYPLGISFIYFFVVFIFDIIYFIYLRRKIYKRT